MDLDVEVWQKQERAPKTKEDGVKNAVTCSRSDIKSLVLFGAIPGGYLIAMITEHFALRST